jgi:hypothetical protein
MLEPHGRKALPPQPIPSPGQSGVTWHEECVAWAGKEAALHATHLAAGQLGLSRGLGPRKALANL